MYPFALDRGECLLPVRCVPCLLDRYAYVLILHPRLAFLAARPRSCVFLGVNLRHRVGLHLIEKDRERDGSIRQDHGSGTRLPLPSAVRAVPGLPRTAKSVRRRASRLADLG